MFKRKVETYDLINSSKLTITRLDQIKSIKYVVRPTYGADPNNGYGSFKENTSEVAITMHIVETTRKCKWLTVNLRFRPVKKGLNLKVAHAFTINTIFT